MSIRNQARSQVISKATLRKRNTKTGLGRDTRSLVHESYIAIIAVNIAIVTMSSRLMRQRVLISVMRLVDLSTAQSDFDTIPAKLVGNDATPSAGTDEAANSTSNSSHK